MKANRLMLLTVAGLALAQSSGSAQPAPGANARGTSSPGIAKLVGSWDVTIETVVQGGPFKALMTFTPEGTLLSAEPSAFETTAFGSWRPTGAHTAAFTFRSYIGSPTGENTGSLKVVGNLRVDREHDSWTGPFKIDVLDPAGDVVFSDTGTFTADRIRVEELE